MFRHACGFQLANQGTDTRTLQAYVGHPSWEFQIDVST
jgi:site-specific recombinase XerD